MRRSDLRRSLNALELKRCKLVIAIRRRKFSIICGLRKKITNCVRRIMRCRSRLEGSVKLVAVFWLMAQLP